MLEQKAGELPAIAAFLALDCNLGAPVGGRFDSDYFKVWAVGSAGHEGKMVLQGARFGVWNLEREFKAVQEVSGRVLYELSLENQNEFPDEFVVRFDRTSGERVYDNNKFNNYHLEKYSGHSLTAIPAGDILFDLGGILPVRLFNQV
jgi:hypothetical protein